jgi:hypothetical protein
LLTVFLRLWQEHVLQPHKSFSPSPAATGTRHSAVPCYLHNGVLTGFFFSNAQRNYNLRVQVQDRRVDAATLSIQNLFLWTSCLVRPTVNFKSYTEILRSLNARLRVCPTSSKPDVLLLHDKTRLHTSVCTTETITNFGQTVILHPPYCVTAPWIY